MLPTELIRVGKLILLSGVGVVMGVSVGVEFWEPRLAPLEPTVGTGDFFTSIDPVLEIFPAKH